jgi:two-component system sensor histidine kinase MprB
VSLRIRLVLVAAAAVAATVVLASIIVFFIVQNDLTSQLNSDLKTAADSVIHRPLVVTGQEKAREFVVDGGGFGGPGAVYFQVVRSNGLMYMPDYAYAAGDPLPVTDRVRKVASSGKGAFFTNTNIASTHVRVYTEAFPGGNGPRPLLAVRVAASLESVDHELSKIELWLAVVALGGIALASGAGFLVARAALAPVRRLSEVAEGVRTTRDLSRRIDVTGNDELSHLATTFNAMLESLDEAAQQQRQLVQDASHELRTPLTSLRTNIEMLASKHTIPAEEREHMLSDVVAQLSEMTALIGELTELARGEEQHPVLEEVRLDLVAQDAIRRTTRNHPDVPIEAELVPTTLVGTPATLERAVANLLDNAAKWTPAGSGIAIRLANNELTVRDHGPGIAESDLPFIFDRFYRATSARSMPGSGLGLAIVKQVAEAHGGTITAERAPDDGTIMRLTFATASTEF